MLLASSSLIISDRRQETRGQPRLSRYSRTVGPVVRENAVMHTPWWRGSVGLNVELMILYIWESKPTSVEREGMCEGTV